MYHMFVIANRDELGHAVSEAQPDVEAVEATVSVYRVPGHNGEQVDYGRHVDPVVLRAAEDLLDLDRKGAALRSRPWSPKIERQLAQIAATGAAHVELILDAPAPGLLLEKNIL